MNKLKYTIFCLVMFLLHPISDVMAQSFNKTSSYLKANGVWVFGRGTGLDFSRGGLDTIKSNTSGNEGFASVVDPVSGKLLFYSNGNKVWDAGHNVMPNGSALMGNGQTTGNPSQITSYRGVGIVPVIGSERKYYLFSVTPVGGFVAGQTPYSGMFYSIVDMSNNNGMGDIEGGKKNIHLNKDTLTEGVTAIPGNNCDIWICVVAALPHPVIKSYRITYQGIDTIPVISAMPNVFPNQMPSGSYGAGLSFSSDRTKAALSLYTTGVPSLVLLNFNPESGEFTQPIALATNKAISNTVFSPDNTKLYADEYVYPNNPLLQFDISVADSTTIVNSLLRITTTKATYDRAFKLYNDTLYIHHINSAICSRIVNPNGSGNACGLQENVITLSAVAYRDFSNDVVLPLLKDTLFRKRVDTLICTSMENGVSIAADSAVANFYTWSTGDTTANIQVTTGGTYWVTYGNFCDKYVDTFIFKESDLSTTINVNGFELGTTGGPFSSYQWFYNEKAIEGATEQKLKVDRNGAYTVMVGNEDGCFYTAPPYEVTNYGETDIDDAKGKNVKWNVYPNPTSDYLYIDSPVPLDIALFNIDGKCLSASKDSKSLSLKGLAQGIYILKITDTAGVITQFEKIIRN